MDRTTRVACGCFLAVFVSSRLDDDFGLSDVRRFKLTKQTKWAKRHHSRCRSFPFIRRASSTSLFLNLPFGPRFLECEMDSPAALQEQPADSIVLEEEIDPNYVPSEQEVLEYVNWLGMDLESDKDLFWIAREGLMAPLPANWKPCKIKTTGDIYYFNFSSGESTWDRKSPIAPFCIFH
jgi:hypothetical protein